MTGESFKSFGSVDELAEFARLRLLLNSTYETNRWASDPMDLMWLFTPRVWRYRVSGLLMDLAEWVDGGDDG